MGGYLRVAATFSFGSLEDFGRLFLADGFGQLLDVAGQRPPSAFVAIGLMIGSVAAIRP
jgi:hypothetical protein